MILKFPEIDPLQYQDDYSLAVGLHSGTGSPTAWKYGGVGANIIYKTSKSSSGKTKTLD